MKLDPKKELTHSAYGRLVCNMQIMRGGVYSFLHLLSNIRSKEEWLGFGKINYEPESHNNLEVLKWMKKSLEDTLKVVNEVLEEIE